MFVSMHKKNFRKVSENIEVLKNFPIAQWNVLFTLEPPSLYGAEQLITYV